jgi:CheY-like chemotaxis protein
VGHLCCYGQAEPEARVLLVEDEEALRSTLRLNFEMEGYDVTTVVNGPDALRTVTRARTSMRW